MDGQEESEAEECDDDQIDQADTHSRCNSCGAERAEVEGCEADGWGESLWYCCQICS